MRVSLRVVLTRSTCEWIGAGKKTKKKKKKPGP